MWLPPSEYCNFFFHWKNKLWKHSRTVFARIEFLAGHSLQRTKRHDDLPFYFLIDQRIQNIFQSYPANIKGKTVTSSHRITTKNGTHSKLFAMCLYVSNISFCSSNLAQDWTVLRRRKTFGNSKHRKGRSDWPFFFLDCSVVNDRDVDFMCTLSRAAVHSTIFLNFVFPSLAFTHMGSQKT